MRKFKSRKGTSNTKLYVLLAIVAFVAIFGHTIIYYQTGTTTEITIVDKEVVIKDGDSKYLIYGEVDGQVQAFENTDLVLAGKFNSSDLQVELRKDSTYTVKLLGW